MQEFAHVRIEATMVTWGFPMFSLKNTCVVGNSSIKWCITLNHRFYGYQQITVNPLKAILHLKVGTYTGDFINHQHVNGPIYRQIMLNHVQILSNFNTMLNHFQFLGKFET